MLRPMNQVVVFHQSGCPACAEYLPRFRRVAVKYRAHLNIQTPNVDRSDKRIQDAAIAYKINAAPTTLVLDQNDKVLKRSIGALTEAQLTKLFEFATSKST
jgi:thiol-disulfide isomerase/thioredoxin